MATPNLSVFVPIKIFKYAQTLFKCSDGNQDETTYPKAMLKSDTCIKTVQHYYSQNAYSRVAVPGAVAPPVNSSMAPEFVKAFFAALLYFKKLDPPTNQFLYPQSAAPLNAALEDIVYDINRAGVVADPTQQRVAAAMAGGGDFDFSKIIKLSKDEPSGFVPYMVNSIAGSYSDEYLSEMNSKIKKVYNQFGGFKKTSKDVIGSLEDLDRLLRDDLSQQVNDSVFKRYYKTYPVTYQTGGAYGDQGKAVQDAWEMYKKGTPEEKEVFNAIGRFMFYADTTPATANAPVQYTLQNLSLNGDENLADKKGFIRFNMKKLRNPTIPAAKYQEYENMLNTVLGGAPAVYAATANAAAGMPARTGNRRSIPILLTMLPDGGGNYVEVLKTAFAYWYSLPNLNAAPAGMVAGNLGLSFLNGAVGPAGDVIDTNCPDLNTIMPCDDALFEKLIKDDLPTGDDVDYKFNTDAKYNKWKNDVRYDENTKRIQRKKNGKWEEVIDPTDKEKYREFFNTSNKCFNSFFRTQTNQECCDLMDLLMQGNNKDFLKKVTANGGITFQALDDSFREVNPYTVIKFLEGFKFYKIKEYSPIHGSIYKYPCYRWWKDNVLKTLPDLTDQQKRTLGNMPSLEPLLDMSVAFINGNINILNPHIDSMDSTSEKDERLEKRNVIRFVQTPYKRGRLLWGPTRETIHGNIGKFMKNKYSPIVPIGLFGGQQFTALIGGSDKKDKKNTEIILDDTEIEPQFATSISTDLKAIIDSLKNNNKFLRADEMRKINEDLNKYAELEVKLYEKILLINKYIKIAYYINDNEREFLSDSKIKHQIAEYLEYFKDYSNKDMELKNLGSVLKNMINDKL